MTISQEITSLSLKRGWKEMLNLLPEEARKWSESLPWEQRRCLLSLCHLLCAANPKSQAEFLDNYTADGLIYKIIHNKNTKTKVQKYLENFGVDSTLNEDAIKKYIKLFYFHSAQDIRRNPDQYLESALRFVLSPSKQNRVLHYILGFELVKMLFQMSWLQHERLYRLQRNQEFFFKTYIKPVQHTHRLNGLISPRDENIFFSKRSYFIRKPALSKKKAIELIMATFTTQTLVDLGFEIIRNIDYLFFDYDYIFQPEQETIFG
ncbi:MAG: cobyrinic acid a,c-diamide synthase [Spirulinaceae cyanobacterium]